MSGHHDKFGRLTQRRALQAASGALRAFRDDLTTSHKGMGWTPRAVVNAHRDALAQACEELEPIIGARLVSELELDRAEKAERFSSAPGARIGEVALPARNEATELESLKTQVSEVFLTSGGDAAKAERGVRRLLATFATKLALRTGGAR